MWSGNLKKASFHVVIKLVKFNLRQNFSLLFFYPLLFSFPLFASEKFFGETDQKAVHVFNKFKDLSKNKFRAVIRQTDGLYVQTGNLLWFSNVFRKANTKAQAWTSKCWLKGEGWGGGGNKKKNKNSHAHFRTRLLFLMKIFRENPFIIDFSLSKQKV